jgi:ATP adenylyltransferase
MEQIWAPWRMEYIRREKTDECIFCTLPQQDKDRENYILHKGPTCFVIMNIFPYNTGHIMVVPYRHLNCLTLLDNEEIAEKTQLTQKCLTILREQFSPEGFNVGMNIGKAGGAGFDEHIHTHIVPRWNGDTNFMPVLADTKVHPEHLQKTYEKLLSEFQKLSS